MRKRTEVVTVVQAATAWCFMQTSFDEMGEATSRFEGMLEFLHIWRDGRYLPEVVFQGRAPGFGAVVIMIAAPKGLFPPWAPLQTMIRAWASLALLQSANQRW
jgi:hypothetical protein